MMKDYYYLHCMLTNLMSKWSIVTHMVMRRCYKKTWNLLNTIINLPQGKFPKVTQCTYSEWGFSKEIKPPLGDLSEIARFPEFKTLTACRKSSLEMACSVPTDSYCRAEVTSLQQQLRTQNLCPLLDVRCW